MSSSAFGNRSISILPKNAQEVIALLLFKGWPTQADGFHGLNMAHPGEREIVFLFSRSFLQHKIFSGALYVPRELT